MAGPYRTLDRPESPRGDPFNAVVGAIAFVLHRQRPANWSIINLANLRYDILAFAVAGRARYHCGPERFDVTRGALLFFPRGVKHSAWSDPRSPWSFYSVGFRLEPIEGESLAAFEQLPHHLRLPNFTQINDYFRQLERLWSRSEPGYDMACRGLVLLLMQQYVAAAAQRVRQRIPHHDRLEAIVRHLHHDVGRIYAVGELARMARLSESRFRLLFSQLTGCSAVRYQNRLRIQVAQDLLASGQYRVSEVAEELGFRDVYYFSRLFKRMCGRPPSAYRRP